MKLTLAKCFSFSYFSLFLRGFNTSFSYYNIHIIR